MGFDSVIGHEKQKSMLLSLLEKERLPHAFLFSGPEGIGKRTVAIAFAKALNCTDEAAHATGDFCGVCRSCRMITLGQHPDVRLLTPETTAVKL